MAEQDRDTPNLASVILNALAAEREQIYVSFPGIVQSYNASEQSVDVQPAVKRGYLNEDQERATEALPVINSVPVVFPGAGAYSITFPINAGDTVLLVFSTYSIDSWLSEGGCPDPLDDRRHYLADAMAIPGLRPFNEALDTPPSNAMVLTANEVRLGGNDATDPVMLKSELDALRTAYNAHLHTAPPGGGPTTTPLAPNIWPPITGATKAKGE